MDYDHDESQDLQNDSAKTDYPCLVGFLAFVRQVEVINKLVERDRAAYEWETHFFI